MVTCTSYTAPSPCSTKNGLEVYCVMAGTTIVMKGQVSYPAHASVAALGVGSVFGQQMTSLGYFLATDPFTCVPTGCDHAVGYGNSGANGKICEVAFDLTQPTTMTGSGLYAIAVDANAADGDYLLGYVANTWTVLTPDFYLRIGQGGVQ
jgi:hypothetical protein